jgi:hypothetical protein
MRQVVGALTRWQWLLLVAVVLLAAWGPAHTAEVAAFDRVVGTVEPSHPVAAANGGEGRGHDDPRCGHRDAERDAMQASSVRLPQPQVTGGLLIPTCGEAPRPVEVDLDVSRAPPGQTLVVMMCVWRQ